MSLNDSINELRKLMKRKRKVLKKERCIAVGFKKENNDITRKLFAISGFDTTQKETLCTITTTSDKIEIKNIKKIYWNGTISGDIKEKLNNIFSDIKEEMPWKMVHLNSHVETCYYNFIDNKPVKFIGNTSFKDYIDVFSIKYRNSYYFSSNIKRVFSCCERKIFSAISLNNNYDIVISRKPCDICDKFIKENNLNKTYNICF